MPSDFHTSQKTELDTRLSSFMLTSVEHDFQKDFLNKHFPVWVIVLNVGFIRDTFIYQTEFEIVDASLFWWNAVFLFHQRMNVANWPKVTSIHTKIKIERVFQFSAAMNLNYTWRIESFFHEESQFPIQFITFLKLHGFFRSEFVCFQDKWAVYSQFNAIYFQTKYPIHFSYHEYD